MCDKDKDVRELNIYEKHLLAVERASNIPKNGHNKHQHYDYVMAVDAVGFMSTILCKLRLILLPSSKITDTIQCDKGWMTNVQSHFTLINVDKPDEIMEWNMPGTGYDSTDKGVFKALTGALKYSLGEAYLIRFGDDPEDDSKDAKNTSKPATKTPKAKTEKKAPTSTSDTEIDYEFLRAVQKKKAVLKSLTGDDVRYEEIKAKYKVETSKELTGAETKKDFFGYLKYAIAEEEKKITAEEAEE